MTTLDGIALVPGSAVGTAVLVRPAPRMTSGLTDARPRGDDLAAARRAAEAELRQRLDTLAHEPARAILRAHISLIGDPTLTTAIAQHFDRGLSAEAAIEQAGEALATRFEALDDPVLRTRAADLRDVCACIASHLRGDKAPFSGADACIVCAAELSPAQVLHLAEGSPLGFVLEHGAEVSHAAILMRAVGVPAIIGVRGALTLIRDGDRILVDCDRGQVIVNPAGDAMPAVKVAASVGRPESDPKPARTRDGAAIAVTATIAGASDARRAMAAGADGIGLFRTEWLFMRHDRLPTEDEQFETYREVAAIAKQRPVTVRAVDLGGDKLPGALRLPPESNPALGLRGVRLAIAFPDLLQIQVRALLRAFAGRRLRLMLPMVTDPGDIAHAIELLERAAGDSASDRLEIGALIETPAAALMVEELAAVVDFLSLGTNDLTQFVLAADRDSRGPTSRYQPTHPAVLRLLRNTAAAAGRLGKPMSVCGEAARDPLMAPILIGMGVSELSVTPEAIVRTKRLVRSISIETARARVEALIALPTGAAVRAQLGEADERQCTPDV